MTTQPERINAMIDVDRHRCECGENVVTKTTVRAARRTAHLR